MGTPASAVASGAPSGFPESQKWVLTRANKSKQPKAQEHGHSGRAGSSPAFAHCGALQLLLFCPRFLGRMKAETHITEATNSASGNRLLAHWGAQVSELGVERMADLLHPSLLVSVCLSVSASGCPEQTWGLGLVMMVVGASGALSLQLPSPHPCSDTPLCPTDTDVHMRWTLVFTWAHGSGLPEYNPSFPTLSS